MTTKRLKYILKTKRLVFLFPKNLFNNKDKLFVQVYPRKGDTEHDVYVNHIHQRQINFESPLHKEWYKDNKTATPSWREFSNDWRYLLGLNVYPEGQDPRSNFLVKYEKSLKHIKVVHPHQTPDALVCVKDTVTKEVIRLSKGIAEVMVTPEKPHLKYCSKREWRHYLNEQKPKILKVDKDLYWKQNETKEKDEEGKEKETLAYPFNFIPKQSKEVARPNYFKVINGKVTRAIKPKRKHNIIPTYDRHAKLQTIVIEPPLENIRIEEGDYWHSREYEVGEVPQEKVTTKEYKPIYVNIPIYGRQPHNKHILFKWKKLFVENIEKDVTFIRDIRIIRKTIITKQYPSELCERRRIIKKNMTLLRQQAEKQKQQEKQVKSE